MSILNGAFQPSLYVDPGSGALLWQVFSAVVVGAVFSFKNLFKWPGKRRQNMSQNDQTKPE